MKKLLSILLCFLLLSTGSVVSQTTLLQYTYQVVMAGQTSVGTLSANIVLSGSSFHQLTWTVSGTVATCSVKVDSSADGVTWNNGDIIAAQTCTSNGTINSSSFVANFVRVNLTALSGAGATFNGVLDGFSQNPAGSGAGNVVNNGVNTFTSSGTLNLAASSVLTGLKLPQGTSPAPIIEGILSWDTTTHGLRCGSSGTTTLRCMQTPLVSGGAASSANLSATQFGKLTGGSSIAGTTEVVVREMLPFTGTITNLCVTTTSTQSSTGTLVFSIKDSTAGSTAGTLSDVIAANAGAGTYCDSVNSAPIIAQHDYVLQVVNNATVGGATVEGISAVYSY